VAVQRQDLERESDIERLRDIALMQHAALETLAARLLEHRRQLAELKGDPRRAQQDLELLEAISQRVGRQLDQLKARTDAHDERVRKTRERSGPTPQPNLPVVEQTFELDVADRICPSCGGDLKPMKDQCETSEMVDVVEVSYRVVKVQQQKYVCRCGSCVETAPGPERAMGGGRYSLAFAIKVALDKYLDHLPLARQQCILARHGLEVTTQTLWDQVQAIARQLEKADQALLEHALAEPVIGLDQTGWPKLDGHGGKPWQMWCVTAPKVVVHRIREDKSASTFKDLVGHYKGTIVCDALGTHGAGARDGPGIVLAGWWAHVFRKFDEAAENHEQACLALKWIGELYDIDEKAGADLDRKAELRRAEAAPILEKMKEWLPSVALKTLSIGKAAAYTLANWDRLTRFLAILACRSTTTRPSGPSVPRGRAQESLRVQVPPRDRSRRHALLGDRDRQAPSRRSRCLPRRRYPSCPPGSGAPALGLPPVAPVSTTDLYRQDGAWRDLTFFRRVGEAESTSSGRLQIPGGPDRKGRHPETADGGPGGAGPAGRDERPPRLRQARPPRAGAAATRAGGLRPPSRNGARPLPTLRVGAGRSIRS
jgi:transposase